MQSACLVIPSCRQEQLNKLLSHITDIDADIIVCEDSDTKTFSLPESIAHYSHEEIGQDLGDKAYIIPHRNASVRSYGYYKAWQQGAKYIVTIDDDCIPPKDFIEKHVEALETLTVSSAWTNTIRGGKARGVPFDNISRSVKTIVNHGLWTGNYDFDAVTQLTHTSGVGLVQQVIERGKYYPMCGMNLAFKAEAVPMMYFLLQGRDYPYDRYDDIWAGLFTKRICDHLNLGVKSGYPFVKHTRASNVWSNLIKESTAYELNEILWQTVDDIILKSDTITGCYRELADGISHINDYFVTLSNAMRDWVSLYEKI